MAEIDDWVRTRLMVPGRANSLAQKLLQLTMPGIPDVYQGQELPDFSLVDPDNRRPVDYELRRRLLAASDPGDTAAAHKLRVVSAALRLRNQRPDAFAAGYTPLAATGSAADHVVAYSRGDDVIVVATRLPIGLAGRGGWDATVLQLPA